MSISQDPVTERSPTGLPLTHSAVVDAHERSLKLVRDFSLYTLRHTFFAAWFYDKTKDLIVLQAALGHRDLCTVLRHVNNSQSRIDRAMKAYEDELS